MSSPDAQEGRFVDDEEFIWLLMRRMYQDEFPSGVFADAISTVDDIKSPGFREKWSRARREVLWHVDNTRPISEQEWNALLHEFSANHSPQPNPKATTVEQMQDWLRMVYRYAWEERGLVPNIFAFPARPCRITEDVPVPEHMLGAYGLHTSAADSDARAQPLVSYIPAIFADGLGSVPACVPMQGLWAALHHAPNWGRMEDGRPYYTHTTQKSGGRVTTYLDLPQPALPDDTGKLPDTVIRVLDDKLRELNDLDGDILTACLVAQTMGPWAADGTTWISVDSLLAARGIKKMIKREGKVTRTAGHRSEDVAAYAESIERLDHMWIDVQEVTILEGQDNKKPRRKKYVHQSKVIEVGERIAQRSLYGYGHDIPIAWRFKVGAWLAPFLTEPNRQVALLLKRVLEYDPYREQWEKRLGRYLTLHLRADAQHGRPLKRNVGLLLNELNLPTDRRNPERTKARLEKALKTLCDDGILGAWGYAFDKELPPRNWLEQWCGKWEVVATAPPSIAARYAALTQKAQRHRRRSPACRSGSTQAAPCDR